MTHKILFVGHTPGKGAYAVGDLEGNIEYGPATFNECVIKLEEIEADILWRDTNTPTVGVRGITVSVNAPESPVRATLLIDDIGYVELQDWTWFTLRDPHRGYRLSKPEDKILWDAMQSVWSWLSEWELVELRPIGPEDSEYFATDKLKETINGRSN